MNNEQKEEYRDAISEILNSNLEEGLKKEMHCWFYYIPVIARDLPDTKIGDLFDIRDDTFLFKTQYCKELNERIK